MSWLTKYSAIAAIAAIVALFAFAVMRGILMSKGAIRDTQTPGPISKAILLGCFCVFGFACMPLMMRVFIAGQGSIGNANLGMVGFLREHFVGVIFGFWGFLLLGLAIAMPAAWKGLSDAEKSQRPTAGPSQGVLRANVGMTMDEIAKASNLPLAPLESLGETSGASQSVGHGVFDFEIPNTGVRCQGCSYYFLETGGKGDARIQSINVCISSTSMSKADTDGAINQLHAQLVTNGWNVAPGDDAWKKDNTLLNISSTRMDDPAAGEDSRTAGKFVLNLEIKLVGSAKNNPQSAAMTPNAR